MPKIGRVIIIAGKKKGKDMRFSPEVQVGFQSQYSNERYSAALYTAIAYALDVQAHSGSAGYFHRRAAEEEAHAHAFAQFLADLSIVPVLEAVPAVELRYSPEGGEILEQMLRQALQHEKTVTGRLESLYFLAKEAESPVACAFLHPYLLEQVEEEQTLERWIERLDMGAHSILIDQEMGK